ncbi:MAG: hypothetical protein WBP79_14785 [Candidatus Acidiferrales bacterium]
MLRKMLMVFGAVLALLVSDVCFAQTRFDRAEYLMAAGAGQKKGKVAKGTLSFDSEKKLVTFVAGKQSEQFSIGYDTITSMLYEQASRPRYAEAILISPMFVFAKEKKHFLTIHFNGEGGTPQFVVVHLDKTNYRNALATAEAQTGKKVDRSLEN